MTLLLIGEGGGCQGIWHLCSLSGRRHDAARRPPRLGTAAANPISNATLWVRVSLRLGRWFCRWRVGHAQLLEVRIVLGRVVDQLLEFRAV